jgi:hypothetical protein
LNRPGAQCSKTRDARPSKTVEAMREGFALTSQSRPLQTDRFGSARRRSGTPRINHLAVRARGATRISACIPCRGDETAVTKFANGRAGQKGNGPIERACKGPRPLRCKPRRGLGKGAERGRETAKRPTTPMAWRVRPNSANNANGTHRSARSCQAKTCAVHHEGFCLLAQPWLSSLPAVRRGSQAAAGPYRRTTCRTYRPNVSYSAHC